MAYLTPAQFVSAFDSRRVLQLLSDTGTPVSAGDIGSNAVVLDLLGQASEMVAAAAMVGKRYTDTQLTTLAASATSGFLLRRLVADLAFALLVARRGQSAADLDRLAPSRAWAEQQLQLLRLGERIFPGVDDSTYGDAGLPSTTDTLDRDSPHRQTLFSDTMRRARPYSPERDGFYGD